MFSWPIITIGAAFLQVVRNASQRRLSDTLGVWGASYVRFVYGLPFALIWLAAILSVRGVSGGFSPTFLWWTLLGAAAQGAATAALVLAMRGRGFAIATALIKTEVLATAALGALIIHDALSPAGWIGAVLGVAGVVLMTRISASGAALSGAFAGIGGGLLFAVASISYRAGAHAWGGDPWVGAACCLTATLLAQTIGGGLLLLMFAPSRLRAVFAAWKPSLTPGAAGATSSALLFTAFAIGPSAAAVKTVQLVDVLIAWVVSRKLFRESTSLRDVVGAALVVAGAIAVLLD